MVSDPCPVWDQMTSEQKFAFLEEWAENLAVANRSLNIDIRSLLGKLLKLDSKITDLKQQLNDNTPVKSELNVGLLWPVSEHIYQQDQTLQPAMRLEGRSFCELYLLDSTAFRQIRRRQGDLPCIPSHSLRSL
jgi:hypothetical protein